LAKYRVQTEKGTYEIETADAPQAQAQQPSPLDYHTGNSLVDAPLGVVQGALKGFGQSTYNLASAVHSIPGVGAVADKIDQMTGSQAPTPQQAQQMFEPRGVGQGTGKFLEQIAEFAVPEAKLGAAVKGLGLGARVAAKATLGAGVSGVQSNFDPTSTAVGGVLGGAGETASAALKAVKAVTGTKAVTGSNVAAAFKATPTEKLKIIAPAIDMLKADGVKVGDSPGEMHEAIKQQISKLSDAYQKLPTNIKQRSVPARDVVQALDKAQQGMYIPGTQQVASGNEAAFKVIQDQIRDIAGTAAQNNGNVTVEQLTHLKNVANSNTKFGNPDEGIYRQVGNAYRQVVDSVAPELTELNKKYALYQQLHQLGEKATGQMRGESQTGLDALLVKAKAHALGATAGASIGGAVAGPIGAGAGSILGGIIGPKLGKAAGQALQNAIDNGAFQALKPSQQLAVKVAAKAGRNSDVLRLLGKSLTMEEATAQ
jgi:hypothetical protein